MMPLSDHASDKAMGSKFLNALRQVVRRSQQEQTGPKSKASSESPEKALDTLRQRIQSSLEEEKLTSESAGKLAETLEKMQASFESILPNVPPKAQTHISETLDQLNQLLQELAVEVTPITTETLHSEAPTGHTTPDITVTLEESPETDPTLDPETLLQGVYEYFQSVLNQHPSIMHELSAHEDRTSRAFLTELLENTSQAAGIPPQIASLFGTQEQQQIKNILEKLPPNIKSLLTEIAKTLPSGKNNHPIDLSSLSSKDLTHPNPTLSQELLQLVASLKPTTVQTLQTQLTSPNQTALAQDFTREQNTIATHVSIDVSEAPITTTTLENVSENLTDIPKDLAPETKAETKLHRLMENLDATLSRLSSSEQTALKDVLNQLAQIQPKPLEKPLNKSIQQIQLEMSFKNSVMKPKAFADVLGEETKTESSLSEATPITVESSAFGTVMASTSTESEANLSQFSQPQPDTALLTIDTSSNATPVQKTEAPQTPFQIQLNGSEKPVHEQVLDAAQMTLEAGKKEISLNLRPAELGSVKLILTSNMQNEVSAKLITSTPDAKALLEKSLQQLTHALKEQGIQIGSINVIQAGSDPNSAQNNADQQPQSQTSWTTQQDQPGFNQQQQQHQQFENIFQDLGFNAFKDGGTSRARDEASSQSSSDTDVGGEEVLSQSQTSQEASGMHSQQAVDIRI